MNDDPLLSHLLDIASDPASEELILTGGFGIRLKQKYLRDTNAITYIMEVPPARATQDLDFFMHINLFVQKERGNAVCELLKRLSYNEIVPKFQFSKHLGPQFPKERMVKIDLHARLPRDGEPVKVKSPRVGADANIGLHGRETPEGFAVEDLPMRISFVGSRTDGQEVEASILVPHPYAWINMKVKAAYDWLRMERNEINRKPNSERHAYDVYVLTAMLTQAEIEQAGELAKKYAGLSIVEEIKAHAEELFASPNAPGFRETARQVARPLDHATFWEGLCEVLDIHT